ncbi:MAG: hypothetical protein WC329_05850, partial [Candidatus Omnitrophota bacterium]
MKQEQLKGRLDGIDDKGALTPEALFVMHEVLEEIKPEAAEELRQVIARVSGKKELARIIRDRVKTKDGQGVIELEFMPAKTRLDYFYGYFGENCTSGNPEELLNPAFTPIRILWRGKIAGCVHTLTLVIGRKKSLVVCGIEPQSPLAEKMDAKLFVTGLLDALATEVASKNGYAQVLVSISDATLSNRENIRQAMVELCKNRPEMSQFVQKTFPAKTSYSIERLKVWQAVGAQRNDGGALEERLKRFADSFQQADNKEKKGSFEFQVGEFEESLNQIGPLLTKLGQPKGKFNNINSAVNWLNSAIEPFQIYVKHIETNTIDEDIAKLLPPNFVNLSEDQLRELALTADGQELKRTILSLLYPQETPKRQKKYPTFYDKIRSFREVPSRFSVDNPRCQSDITERPRRLEEIVLKALEESSEEQRESMGIPKGTNSAALEDGIRRLAEADRLWTWLTEVSQRELLVKVFAELMKISEDESREIIRDLTEKDRPGELERTLREKVKLYVADGGQTQAARVFIYLRITSYLQSQMADEYIGGTKYPLPHAFLGRWARKGLPIALECNNEICHELCTLPFLDGWANTTNMSPCISSGDKDGGRNNEQVEALFGLLRHYGIREAHKMGDTLSVSPEEFIHLREKYCADKGFSPRRVAPTINTKDTTIRKWDHILRELPDKATRVLLYALYTLEESTAPKEYSALERQVFGPNYHRQPFSPALLAVIGILNLGLVGTAYVIKGGSISRKNMKLYWPRIEEWGVTAGCVNPGFDTAKTAQVNQDGGEKIDSQVEAILSLLRHYGLLNQEAEIPEKITPEVFVALKSLYMKDSGFYIRRHANAYGVSKGNTSHV